MRLFNAFQLVAMFAAMPLVIEWLGRGPFHGATVAFWIAIAVYAVAFAMMVGSVWRSIDDRVRRG